MNSKLFMAGLTALGLFGVPARSASAQQLPRTPVSVRSVGTPVADVLRDLAEQAHVRLTAGDRLGPRRFFLVARQRPFAEVLGRLQAFAANPPGKVILGRLGSGLVLEEDLQCGATRARAVEKYVRQREAKATKDLAATEAWVKKPLSDDDPTRYLRKPVRRWIALFRALPASAQRQLLRGGQLTVRYGALLASAQKLTHGTVAFHNETNPGRAEVEFSPSGTMDKPGLCVYLNTTGDSGPAWPDILHAPIVTKDDVVVGDLSSYERRRRRGPENEAQIPALQRLVTLTDGVGWYLPRAVAEFSARSGVPLIGDYDPGRGIVGGPNLNSFNVSAIRPNMPAWELLEAMCRQYDLEWEYDRGWVVLHSPRTILAWAGLIDLSPPGAPQPSR
jgi:hypothetical protein